MNFCVGRHFYKVVIEIVPCGDNFNPTSNIYAESATVGRNESAIVILMIRYSRAFTPACEAICV